MIPAVLSRLNSNVVPSVQSQDLAFTIWMHLDMDKTVFWLDWRVIYISFSALISGLTHCGVSLRRVEFFYLLPAVKSTVGIFIIRFLIGGFYHTFINWFINFHTFKHGNWSFKQNRSSIKTLHIILLVPTIMHTLQQIFIQFSYSNFQRMYAQVTNPHITSSLSNYPCSILLLNSVVSSFCSAHGLLFW